LPSYSLYLSLNYSLRQRRSLHCAVTHYFCLYITVCGSGAVCIVHLHQVTHYLSLHCSLWQRRSLHWPVTSNYSLFVFILQFVGAAQSALRSYIESLIICLLITVCGSDAVCIAQLHQIIHYLSFNYSLRQRRSLYCPATHYFCLYITVWVSGAIFIAQLLICLYITVCGSGAVCIAQLHRPVCACPDGFDGNPYDKCKKVLSSSFIDCFSLCQCGNFLSFLFVSLL
jgi:hypothetical protein